MGELLAVMALVLFSVNVILTKAATQRLNLNIGFLITVSTNVLFATLLFIGQLLIRDTLFQWNTTGFFLFVLAGFFSTYLGRWLFFDTIAKLGPAKASTFQAGNPIFTVLIAWFFLGEVLRLLNIIAIIVVIFGLFLVSYRPGTFSKSRTAATVETNQEGSDGKQPFYDWKWLFQAGVFIAILSTLAYAIGNVLRGAAIQSWNEPIFGGLVGALIGLVLHYSFSPHKKDFFIEMKKADRKGIWIYVASGILTISAQIFSIASVFYIPVSIANLITMSTPLLVTPISYFFLKNEEHITIYTLTGIILVLIGITTIIIL